MSRRNTVRVVRGIRFYDAEIDEVRYQVWQKSEKAFLDLDIECVDVQELPNDSRSLRKYLVEQERQRLEAKRRNNNKS
jgi:hypothetical protein